MNRRASLAAAIAALALLAPAPSSAASAAPVPARFFGVVAEPELLTDSALTPAGSTLEDEFAQMQGAGVGAARISFFWARAQPYESWEDVPDAARSEQTDVHGRPYSFAALDRIVGAAAARRIDVLPVVLWPPGWAARYRGEFASPPRDPAEYGRFLAVLAERYGPKGSFWAAHPDVPRRAIRDWQAWNEPTMPGFWLDQPFARGYVRLLRAARARLRRVDPKARLVLAGLVYDSPGALRQIYEEGGRRYFDVAALHPFTREVKNVGVLIERARKVMREYGDARKPALITELSWPSAKGRTTRKYGYEMSESGQASRLSAALRFLASRRRALRIERVYWYSWLTRERDTDYPFDYAGLRRLEADRIVSKPALRAFRDTALDLQRRR